MFKSIISFIIAVYLMIAGMIIPPAKESPDLDGLSELTDICKDFELSDKLYILDSATFKSTEERHMAIGLQGVVAKTTPLIFIINNEICHDYLAEIEKSGIELIYNDDNGNRWTLETLLNKFKSYIGESGYVLYRPTPKAEGLNTATNLAALYGWLPVPDSLESLAISAGLTLKEDISDDEYSVRFLNTFFEKHKNEFSTKAVVSQKYDATGLRDLAIQQGFYTFYIDDDEDSVLFRKKVIDFADDNAPVLGWGKYEVHYVEQASKCGNFVLPTDHSHNNSFLASFKCEVPNQPHQETKTYTDPTKHYCAIVFSDGDNIQWIQNGYSEYYQKLALEEQFPMTWSFPPLLEEFSSVTAKKVYSDASENDYFIAGVSGAGYNYPTDYPLSLLDDFTNLTAFAMSKNDLHYVSILDTTPQNAVEEMVLIDRLEYYSRHDNIDGGIISLDPDRYAGGQGKIYFSNGKPFMTYRLSLWHPDGEGATVTKEWLDEQAAIVNSYPADINSINGYSVINVHPWTISIEDLAYFVSQLDDDVVLVTLDEMMAMTQSNLPHQTAAPIS